MITKNDIIFGGLIFSASLFVAPYEVNAQWVLIAFFGGGAVFRLYRNWQVEKMYKEYLREAEERENEHRG